MAYPKSRTYFALLTNLVVSLKNCASKFFCYLILFFVDYYAVNTVSLRVTPFPLVTKVPQIPVQWISQKRNKVSKNLNKSDNGF